MNKKISLQNARCHRKAIKTDPETGTRVQNTRKIYNFGDTLEAVNSLQKTLDAALQAAQSGLGGAGSGTLF